MQPGFAHGAFQTQRQTIVKQRRVTGSIVVADQCVGDAAAFQQAIPVGAAKATWAQYRRLRARLGAPKAITAMARKLSCLFYRLLKQGRQYFDKGVEFLEAKHRERQIRSVLKRARKLGLHVAQPVGKPA